MKDIKRTIEVEVKGICPLLQHRFYEDKSKTKKDHDSEKQIQEEFDNASYKNSKGQYIQLSEHFEACFVKAGGQFKFEKSAKYGQVIKSGVFVSPTEIVHKIQKPEIDRRPVVIKNGANRSRIWRVRPRFDNWELKFIIEVIDERINLDVLKDIVMYAGVSTGIGDWRPKFGRFEVMKWKVC